MRCLQLLVTKIGLGVPKVILWHLLKGVGSIFLCADEYACSEAHNTPSIHPSTLEEMGHKRRLFRSTHDTDVLATHVGYSLDPILIAFLKGIVSCMEEGTS